MSRSGSAAEPTLYNHAEASYAMTEPALPDDPTHPHWVAVREQAEEWQQWEESRLAAHDEAIREAERERIAQAIEALPLRMQLILVSRGPKWSGRAMRRIAAWYARNSHYYTDAAEA